MAMQRCKCCKATNDVRGMTVLVMTTAYEPEQGKSDTVAFNSFKVTRDMCRSCRDTYVDCIKRECAGMSNA